LSADGGGTSLFCATERDAILSIFFYSLDFFFGHFFCVKTKEVTFIYFAYSKKAKLCNTLSVGTFIFRRPHPNLLLKGEGPCYLSIIRLCFSLWWATIKHLSFATIPFVALQ
jgi:hypothetical protein